MNIYEFVQSKQITIEELTKVFTIESELEINASNVQNCYNCGDELNNEFLPSESWTSVQHCRKCNRINAVVWSDRMGGSCTDTVMIFADSNSLTNKPII